MSILIGVKGPSGSGKTTSLFPNDNLGIEGLNPKTTIYVNVAAKPMPIKGAFNMYDPNKAVTEGGNYTETSDPGQIGDRIKWIHDNREDINVVVVDDANYVMAFRIMTSGKMTYDQWRELAANTFYMVNTARGLSRKDFFVIFIFHPQTGKDDVVKLKTAGAMIDNYIYLDGLFTFILDSYKTRNLQEDKYEYYFTALAEFSTAKAPDGCFENPGRIPNDMGGVVNAIHQYYFT